MTPFNHIVDALNTVGIPFNNVNGVLWFTVNGNMASIDSNTLDMRVFGGGLTLRRHEHRNVGLLIQRIGFMANHPSHWSFN